MTTSMLIGADQVTAQPAEAGATLRAMAVHGCRPASCASAWPDFRPDPDGEPPLGGAHGTPARPSPEAISAMERVLLTWPQLIPASRVRERQAVLKRAEGLPWRRIGMDLGLTHEGARKAHHTGVTRIAAALNRSVGALRDRDRASTVKSAQAPRKSSCTRRRGCEANPAIEVERSNVGSHHLMS